MPEPNNEDHKNIIAIWEKAVDTQMHFNEMSVKSRQFGLTFVAAALGLGIVLLTRGQEFSIYVPVCGGFTLHMTVLIILSGAFALYAVSLLDLHVYHKMLRGAVTFGEDFEENYLKRIFQLEKGMTQAISHYSRYSDARVTTQDGKYVYGGKLRKNAGDKIRVFYRVAIGLLIVAAILLFIVTGNFGQPEKASAVHVGQTNVVIMA